MRRCSSAACDPFASRTAGRLASTRPTSRSAASGVTCAGPSTSTASPRFPPEAKRDLEAAKRFFRKMLKDQPLCAPARIGTDGAGPYPPAITAARKEGLPRQDPLHYVSKHLQQGIESD